MSSNTLMETLKITFTEIGDNYVVCKMPVTSEVHQPAGILHGGATAALVETVGSFASRYFIKNKDCLLYTSPSPRDRTRSRMPSSA